MFRSPTSTTVQNLIPPPPPHLGPKDLAPYGVIRDSGVVERVPEYEALEADEAQRDSAEHLLLEQRGERHSGELFEWAFGGGRFALPADAAEAVPPGGRAGAEGADASHAWFQFDAPTSDSALESFVIRTILEGCVRGTLVSLEATFRAERASPELRAAYLAIAARESESTLVAWGVAAKTVGRIPDEDRPFVAQQVHAALDDVGFKQCAQAESEAARLRWKAGLAGLAGELHSRLGLGRV